MSLRPCQASIVVCGLIYLGCLAANSKADEPASTPSAGPSAKKKAGDSDAQELLGYLRKLQRSQGRNDTRPERIESCQQIVTTAEKIRKLNADDESVTAAVKAEFDALATLARLDDEDAADKLQALTAELSKDKRPAIANLVKARSLQRKLDELDADDAKAVELFVGEIDEVMQSSPPDMQLVPLAKAAVVLLHRIKKRDEAAAAAKQYADKLAVSMAPDVVVGAIQLASLAGQIMELEGKEMEAGQYYRSFVDRLAKNDNSDVKEALEQLAAPARRLEMIGKPMPVTGKLLEGKTFDIAQYKGKVVLVDFWATWCGPCVAELPNVKKVYAKYHDRGFEVVGISLDSDEEELRGFLKKERLAWPILFGGGDDADGWSHPMAKKYEITAIPAAILLDRQGKVVSVHARGERLGELVAKLLD